MKNQKDYRPAIDKQGRPPVESERIDRIVLNVQRTPPAADAIFDCGIQAYQSDIGSRVLRYFTSIA